jgi:hypothetical protein
VTPTSSNIPGGFPKIIQVIISIEVLIIKILDPPLLFGYQKTVPLFMRMAFAFRINLITFGFDKFITHEKV